MKILITGATGFIGRQVTLYLRERGHEIVVLTRDSEKAPVRLPIACPVFSWKGAEQPPPREAFADVDAVVHLAGENIINRWTPSRKKEIIRSRAESTRQLVTAMQELDHKPKVFVCASAIGYYGDRGDEALDESAGPGEGFLPNLCRQWEQAARQAEESGIRVVSLRIGVVLGHDGGALQPMLPPFRMGLGGKVGSGKQWMSWIHVRDLAGLILHAIETDTVKGPVNAVGPHPASNVVFTQTLAMVLKRPHLFAVPEFVLKIIIGETSQVVLTSQRVIARKAIESGYEFAFVELKSALEDICGREDHELLFEQWVPRPMDEVFAFFGDAQNLELLTPPHLRFKVLSSSTDSLQAGTLIDYKLQLHGIPFRWQSLIGEWNPSTHFSDTQMRGPYKKWHHTHTFIEQDGGTLMRDHALYRLPFGVLGDTVAYFFVKRDLEKIFSYRIDKVRELFWE
jgi:uncharacterized protein (TIGR01777 family)